MTGPSPVRLHVADSAVARIAADRARRVPGVVALRGDLAQALLGIADSVLQLEREPSTDGVRAVVDGDAVEVSVRVVTRLGYCCRDLAQAVQLEVAAAVTAQTGLRPAVTVTITDILLP